MKICKILLLGLILTSIQYSQTKTDSLLNQLPQKSGADKVNIYNELAYLYRNNLELALKYSKESKELSESIGYDEGLAESHYVKSQALYTSKKFDESLQSLYSSTKILDRINDNLLKAKVLNQIGLNYERKYENNTARIYFKKALAEIATSEPKSWEYEPNNNLGLSYWRTSQYDSAIVYYESAKNIAINFKDSARIGRILNNIGIVYWQWNLYDKALNNYIKSLKIRTSQKDTIGMCRLLNNIGVTYVTTKEFDKSREYFIKAKFLGEEISNNEQIAYSLFNIAHSYLEERKLQLAEDYYKKSSERYEDAELISGKLLTYIQLAKIRNMFNTPDSALYYSNIAYDLAVQLNNTKRKSMALLEIGNAHFLKKEFQTAEQNYQRALKLSKDINKLDLTTEIYQKLAELNENQGNLKAALGNYKLYYVHKDSLNNQDIQRRILEYQTKYDTEKAQSELKKKEFEIARSEDILVYGTVGIVILLILITVLIYFNHSRKKALKELNISYDTIRDQKDEISEQKKILEDQNSHLESAFSQLTAQKNELDFLNAAKDKLFSVLAHDIKNPLGAITGYSKILKEDFAEMDKKESEEMIDNLHSCGTQLEDLLMKILTWSKNQQGLISVSKSNLNLYDITSSATAPLIGWIENKNINLEINTDGKTVYADAFMLETILRNLIHNSVKFTEDGGTISVEISENENNSVIQVSDTGIGLEKEKLEQLLSDRISVSDTGTGLGFRIVKEFINKMNGSISAISEKGKGTTFNIQFPKEPTLT